MIWARKKKIEEEVACLVLFRPKGQTFGDLGDQNSS